MDLEQTFIRLDAAFREALGRDALALYAVPERSAFLAVTRDRASGPREDSLRELHRALDSPVLQGSYAPASDLASPMSVGRSWLRLSPGSGELLASPTDNTAYWRWLMLHRSTTVHGPVPERMIHEIDAHGLRAEAVGLARFRAEEIEDHPGLLKQDAGRVGLVTDLCSLLHTAVKGQVLLGPPVVGWALDLVPEREQAVLASVLAGRSSDPTSVRSFAWEIHRLVGTAALRLRED